MKLIESQIHYTRMTKERLQYIDVAKALCILLVVIGHILQFNFKGNGSDTAFNFIYSFHMPVFMLLSGYVAALSKKRIDRHEAANFISKKFRSLVVPFFVWGLLITPFVIRQLHQADFIPTAKQLVLNPSCGAWFIVVLFCIQMSFLLFKLISQRINIKARLIADGCSFVIVFGLLLLLSTSANLCKTEIMGG